MKEIRIACLFPIASDPTSWYRGAAPLERLSKTDPYIKLIHPIAGQPISWDWLLRADVLFLQRPAMPEHFQILSLAKDMGLKVIVDIDDDNLAVPKDNPTYQQYNQMPVKEALLNIARNSDQIWTTTNFMSKKYGIYNKETHIIPNALDDRLLHLRKELPKGPREKKLVWRGTMSHQRNLMTIGLASLSIAKNHPDWRFVYFGCDPIDLTDRIQNSEVIPQVSLTDFYKILPQIHGTILYYPLMPNDHAQARSHISWLEATWGNMLYLGYMNEELMRPGALNFDTPQSFEAAIDAVIRGEFDIDEKIKESWDEIQSKYLLSHTNKKRLELIEALVA